MDNSNLSPDRLTKAIRLAKETIENLEQVSLSENTGLLLEMLAADTDKPKLEYTGQRWMCMTTCNGQMYCGSSVDSPLYAIEDLLKQIPKANRLSE
jgi:hypothetical protein